MKAKRIGIEEVRVNFTEILISAQSNREKLLITRHGKPLAMIIPFDNIPTIQAADEALTPAQKKWGALARMMPSKP